MLGKIENSELQLGLPSTGVLKDGRTVSNYDLLPMEILTTEGWKEVIESRPDTEELLEIETFTENEDTITVTYKVLEL